MKVAIVLVTRWWRASIDLDGYCAELGRQGHSPMIVCRGNDAGPADFPVVEATAEESEDPAFWKRLGLDIAIVFSWLRCPALVLALREAGTKTILRADNDGMASARVFPGAMWEATVASAANFRDRLRCGRHWARRCLSLYREEDAVLLAAVDAADAVAIESGEAATHLRTLFAYHGRHDLDGKVHVVPHSVTDPFLTAPFCTENRPRRIFCGGRWDDPQKDAPLLVATLRQLLKQEADLEVVIAGSGTDEAFRVFKEHPCVRLLGRVPQAEVPAILGQTQFLLSTSRWETQPIGTLEVLCMGGSVVAPPLPGLIALADGDRSGTLATKRTAKALAKAASRELARWAAGERNSEEIASRWRSRVSREAVITGLLSTIA